MGYLDQILIGHGLHTPPPFLMGPRQCSIVKGKLEVFQLQKAVYSGLLVFIIWNMKVWYPILGNAPPCLYLSRPTIVTLNIV